MSDRTAKISSGGSSLRITSEGFTLSAPVIRKAAESAAGQTPGKSADRRHANEGKRS